jgi:two-component system response regulator NreC
MTERTRVLLVDDHAIERRGARAILEACADIVVVGEASNGLEALQQASSLAPDVIITETVMPGLSGPELARGARQLRLETRVVMLTRCEDRGQVLSSIQAGASAYLEKTVSAAELISAVRAVSNGGRALTPRALEVVVRDYQDRVATDGSTPGPHSVLTPRQRSVLTLIADGFTESQIAVRLGLCTGTVAQHRRKLMTRLGCRKTADLSRYARRARLAEVHGGDAVTDGDHGRQGGVSAGRADGLVRYH